MTRRLRRSTVLAESSGHRPQFIGSGPTLARFGPASAPFGAMWADFGECWGDSGRMTADVCQTRRQSTQEVRRPPNLT